MNEIAPAPSMNAAILESLVTQGDVSKLTPAQKTEYYLNLCDSLGLNPATQPFAYLKLNGKEKAYATKDATDQLRRIHKVSLQLVETREANDVISVRARASLPDGRMDESTGAVSIAGLRGQELANAFMKAETKAKRRATLSICGLGFLDESETGFATQPEKQGAIEALPHRPSPTPHVNDGASLSVWLQERDAGAAKQGRCQPGELIAFVVKQGEILGYPPEVVRWGSEAIRHAKDWVRTFASSHPSPDDGSEIKRRQEHLASLLRKTAIGWDLFRDYQLEKLGALPVDPKELTSEQLAAAIGVLEEEVAYRQQA